MFAAWQASNLLDLYREMDLFDPELPLLPGKKCATLSSPSLT